jgi:hypothetical protein
MCTEWHACSRVSRACAGVTPFALKIYNLSQTNQDKLIKATRVLAFIRHPQLPLVYSTLGGHGKEALKYVARAGLALCETVSWGEASPQEATAYVIARTAFQAVNSLGPVWREFVQRSRQAQTASRSRPPRQHRGTVHTQINVQSSLAGRAPGQPLSYGPMSRGSDLGLP